jgi:glutamate--cysteine ligase
VVINAGTMRFLDVFLLHCLLADSPPDTPDEIAALGRNQHRTAAFGREPGLKLERGGREVTLVDWAAEILEQCQPIARALDALHGGTLHAQQLAAAQAALADPDTLPSARVLAAMQADFAGSHARFTQAQSLQTRAHFRAQPLPADERARFEAQARESIAERMAIEAADTVDFESWRRAYLAPERLGV